MKWALVGGLAVGTRASPRTTRDVDVAVAVAGDAAAEACVATLAARGYALQGDIEQTATRRLATVHVLSPVGDVAVDLLFASSGIETEVVAEAEPMEVVARLPLPVARTGHLIALKLLARDDRSRPQDIDDLRALSAVADDAEWARAAHAIALIQSRGAARGRSLKAALGALRKRRG